MILFDEAIVFLVPFFLETSKRELQLSLVSSLLVSDNDMLHSPFVKRTEVIKHCFSYNLSTY